MQNKAFTIIEMMVVVTIFSLLMGVGTGLFVSTLKAQRQSLATQELLDQGSYLIEYMVRALRMAQKDVIGNCTQDGTNTNYAFVGQCVKFINSNGICQQFCLDSDTKIMNEIKGIESIPLTSNALEISSFNVALSGQYQPPTDYLQPKLTISFEILGREQTSIKIQSTISQRNPDIQK